MSYTIALMSDSTPLQNNERTRNIQPRPQTTVAHSKLINDANYRFKQEPLTPKETVETLKIKDPEARVRKINNPGIPVASSIGCHSTNISKFVDYHLQPIVKIYLVTCKIQMTF